MDEEAIKRVLPKFFILRKRHDYLPTACSYGNMTGLFYLKYTIHMASIMKRWRSECYQTLIFYLKYSIFYHVIIQASIPSVLNCAQSSIDEFPLFASIARAESTSSSPSMDIRTLPPSPSSSAVAVAVEDDEEVVSEMVMQTMRCGRRTNDAEAFLGVCTKCLHRRGNVLRSGPLLLIGPGSELTRTCLV